MRLETWNVDAPQFGEPWCFRPGTEVFLDFGRKSLSRRSRKALSEIYGQVGRRPDVRFVAYTDGDVKGMPPPNMDVYLIKEVDFVKYKIQLC